MIILEQKYRPQSRPLYKRPLMDNFVMCPVNQIEHSINHCFNCSAKVKVNFDTVHCGYVQPKHETMARTWPNNENTK